LELANLCAFRISVMTKNKWLIVDFVLQRHGFQLKIHHKVFGCRAPLESAGSLHFSPLPLAGFKGKGRKEKGKEGHN